MKNKQKYTMYGYSYTPTEARKLANNKKGLEECLLHIMDKKLKANHLTKKVIWGPQVNTIKGIYLVQALIREEKND